MIITVQCVSLNLLIKVCAQTLRDAELKIIPGTLADLWVGWRRDKIRFSGCNERWLWRRCACARSLREEVEDRKFCVFEHWQITWLCLMIWQHLLTSCNNIWAIHHLYRFIALGSTTFLSTHDFSCLVSWRKASYSSFSRGSTQMGRLYSMSDYGIYVSETFLSAIVISSLRHWL